MGRKGLSQTGRAVNPLPLSYINDKAPYKVTIGENEEIEFVTEYGVEYRIFFMEDSSIWEDNAYQFLINKKNRKASPNDIKLKETILAIIEAFFLSNPYILLYICETGDSLQAARNRLFVKWFHESENRERYYFKDVTVHADGIDNFAALILQKSNPEIKSIISQFDEFISLMQNKPTDE